MDPVTREQLEKQGPLLIAGLSIVILATAFASEYWGGLQPCHLCWLQRYPYMVTIVLGLGAAVTQRMAGNDRIWRALVLLCGLAFAVGGGIAAYHVGVEQKWWAGPDSCTSTITGNIDIDTLMTHIINTDIVRCDEPAWTLYGISMAGYNVLASIGMLLLCLAVSPLRKFTLFE